MPTNTNTHPNTSRKNHITQEEQIKEIVQDILHEMGVSEHPVECFGEEGVDFEVFCNNLAPDIKKRVGSRLVGSVPRGTRMIKNRSLPFIGTLKDFLGEFSGGYRLAFNALDESTRKKIKVETEDGYARWCLMRDTKTIDSRSFHDLECLGETAIYSPAAFLCQLKFSNTTTKVRHIHP